MERLFSGHSIIIWHRYEYISGIYDIKEIETSDTIYFERGIWNIQIERRKSTIIKILPEMIMKSFAQLAHLTFLS